MKKLLILLCLLLMIAGCTEKAPEEETQPDQQQEEISDDTQTEEVSEEVRNRVVSILKQPKLRPVATVFCKLGNRVDFSRYIADDAEYDDSKVNWDAEGDYPVTVKVSDEVSNTFIVSIRDEYTFKLYVYARPDGLQYGVVEYIPEEDYGTLLQTVNDDIKTYGDNANIINRQRDYYNSVNELIEDQTSYTEAGGSYPVRYEIYDTDGTVLTANVAETETKKMADKIYEYLVSIGYNNSDEYSEYFHCYAGFTVEAISETDSYTVFRINDRASGLGTRQVGFALLDKEDNTVYLVNKAMTEISVLF